MMAVVRTAHNPDAFITVTCNPKWPEIKRELLGNQDQSSRADIINRVFKIKLQAILKDLLEHGAMGRTIAHLYVIEFQKRGLPHAHILLFFHPEDRPRTTDDVDKHIIF